MEWLFYGALLVLALAIVGGILTGVGKAKQARNARLAITLRRDFEASDSFVSEYNLNGIAIEDATKRVLLSVGTQCRVLEPDEVMGVELMEDNSSLLKTNRGSQLGGVVVGGLLLGGVGAVVGGLSGSKRSTSKVNKLTLKISTTDFKEPNHDLVFFEWPDKGLDRDSSLYKPKLKEGERWHSRVTQVMKSVSTSAESSAAVTASVADELQKLADLRSQGVLSDQEFAEQKARLLQ